MLRNQGPKLSEKKSLTMELRKLAIATVNQFVHVLIVRLIILVVGDGPTLIKSECKRPIELKPVTIMTSHIIMTVIARRLSSNRTSSTFIQCCSSKCVYTKIIERHLTNASAFHSNSASVSKNRLVHQPMISGQMNGPVDSTERVEGSDEAVDPRKEGGDGGV